MCGIYGTLALRGDAPRPAASALERMAAVTVHRGPDDEGRYVDAQVALGMRRLSIIDVAGGHQPISNEDGTLHVVCNGEIYNYRELGAELQAKGHCFRTRSDTEVLVHLYEEYGDDLVLHLNGMFAFALWDARRRRLLLGRDRLGIKPLYYREEPARLLFASEAKAILTVADVAPAVDPAGLHDYLALGYTPAPTSFFRGIRKLPPASLLVAERGRVRVTRFWAPRAEPTATLHEEEWAETLLATMDRAVAAQMVSDVPLGAFLSGGIDSSTIVALMARHSDRPVKTYAIGFAGASGAAYYNELPWARRVAQVFGTDHREILVTPDVTTLLPRLLWHMDEPVADTALVTTYLVAEFARQDVTVILSGVGGDELFGGYRRYLGPHYDRLYARLPRWFRDSVAPRLARALPSDRHSPIGNLVRHARAYVLSHGQSLEERYRSFVQIFPPSALPGLLREPLDTPDRLTAAFAAAVDGDALSRMSRVDLLTQLPDDLLLLTDKMTMATSLECRVPFLDNTIVDLSLRMPSELKIRGGHLKHVLKRALVGLLPPEILARRKRGFGAPAGAWFRAELAALVQALASRESVEKRGLIHWEPVEQVIAAHGAGREDCTDHLVALVNLEVWCRIYLDGRSPDDVSIELKELVRS